MKKEFAAYYRPSADEFAAMFKQCVFIFDTNVLLNLYRYTVESRNHVLANLRQLKGRIWLPHQVGLEYHRNRIEELLTQHALIDKLETELSKAIVAVKNLGRGSMLFAVNALIEPVCQDLASIRDRLQEKKEKRPDLMEGDPILAALTEIFADAVGPAYSQELYDKICDEGKHRYEKAIPPGYKDRSPKPGDTDQYGDLVIWKQILDYAKTESRPLVFVTDDTKEDWWNEKGGEKLGPRVELRAEFCAETNGKWFYMYSTEQFLKHAQQHLGAHVPAKVIQEAEGIEDVHRRMDLEGAEDALPIRLTELAGLPKLMCMLFGAHPFLERYKELSEDDHQKLAQIVDSLLNTLTYKEREIIRLRTGLGDGWSYTLDECARIFKATRNEIRRTEAKAIRKLQHPVRARRLEEFI